jgi:hypothetical protein
MLPSLIGLEEIRGRQWQVSHQIGGDEYFFGYDVWKATTA